MPAPPPEEAVRAQLERILASPGFVNAGRLSRFLRFVVERTLAGDGDRLKEYLLGTEVFDRPADYDPRLDSIVRVEARRLRAKLQEYYGGAGLDDAVVISVDKGSYVARFEERPAPETAPAAGGPADTTTDGVPVERPPVHQAPVAHAPRLARWSPLLGALAMLAVLAAGWRLVARDTASASTRVQVAVLPLARYDTTPEPVPDALADAVTDGLIAELARHPGVEVASRTSVMAFRAQRTRLAEVAATLGVEAAVEGRVRVDGPTLWLEIRVVDVRRDRKVWVDEFSGETANRRELERRAAAALAGVLTARFGPAQTVE
jgi:TolB-like protein